jgi:hypothetical protein
VLPRPFGERVDQPSLPRPLCLQLSTGGVRLDSRGGRRHRVHAAAKIRGVGECGRFFIYNNLGKLKPRFVRLNLVHQGDAPYFTGFEP